jgi:hypothetical protein
MIGRFIARLIVLNSVAACIVLVAGCTGFGLSGGRATPIPYESVTQLLSEPPPAGTAVEIDAYYSKYLPGTYIPTARPGEMGCPRFSATLADTISPSCQSLANGHYTCGGPPAGFVFVQVVRRHQIVAGEEIFPPSLPYHARYVGHFGDPRLAHCEDNERILVIDRIVQIYEKEFPVTTP